MKRFDKFSAVFTPARTDDLQPGVAEWIGKRLVVQYDGEVEHECDYAGQPRFNVFADGFPATWVAGCDLSDLQPV